MTDPLVAFGLIECELETGHDRYAGLAVERFAAGDRTPGLIAYMESLPAGIVEAIVAARETHVWAPCSTCGAGILVEAPSVPQKPRDGLRDADGPKCRLTWTTVTVGPLTTVERCKGRHYPLHGPWLASHPLGRDLVPARPW